MYRCEAASVRGFVQQLAVGYLTYGYWFYVTGTIGAGKDPRAVDAKLISKYGIDVGRTTRARRKRAGFANVQYLRHDRFFVLIATHGRHLFYDEERGQIQDIRNNPLKFHGYSISYRGGHPHVRIELDRYRELKAYFLDLAAHRSAETLETAFRNLHWEPYAPIRSQLLVIHRAVNRKRAIAQYEPLSRSCLRLRREPCKPFALQVGEPLLAV